MSNKNATNSERVEAFNPDKKNGVHLFGISNEFEGFVVEAGDENVCKLLCDAVTINGEYFGCNEYVELEAHDYKIQTERKTVCNIIIEQDNA